jgi:hypothetical protein
MRFVGFALEFRVILATDKIGMITKLDQLGQRSVRGRTGNNKAFFIHLITIFHVELVSVAMALHHLGASVNFFRDCSFGDFRGPCAQTHAGAHVLNASLLFQQ